MEGTLPVSEPLPWLKTLAQALTPIPGPLPEAPPTAEEQAIVELLQAALTSSATPEPVARPTRPRTPKTHTPD
ncbi:hypothetical protein [Hymenobacter sp. UYP22]|uniref:hypothetical protein n=1 Tax=Hymenobacter sp. UYP22 TaxID=3156348 RepID=UPI003394DC2F